VRTLLLFLACSIASAITVEYPRAGTVFPPQFPAPELLWRDNVASARVWRIEIGALRFVSRGPRPRLGAIDPDCVAPTNRPPRLEPEFAASHAWRPAEAVWRKIQAVPDAPVRVVITGYADDAMKQPVSHGETTFTTSRDPVGAPIFYRDVPLMPTETENGSIKPLATSALRLVKWRLRDVTRAESRVVLEKLPMCANCHSFALNGKTMGLDLDGPRNNKGLYTLTPIEPQMQIGGSNVIQWATAEGPLVGGVRIGFMSQVSPDGAHVVTAIDSVRQSGRFLSNYYVANFKDYRYLQVFYPTRGILAWYSRESGILKPLPGADDPRYVQANAVWTPDGKDIIFARAEAQDPNPPATPLARTANDANERRVRYDLYRIPFNNGLGGVAVPVAGASANGMSNSFPKVSPDGRWIVYVQARNGLLMRPDSQLYIVPATGGTPRRLRSNGPRMNSWHSFSPNGRWLVFSSKLRSPYTQLYLTHIDEQGADSPAVLIENTTASNRASNIPEFVNTSYDNMQSLGGPAIEAYRLMDRALYYQRTRQFAEAADRWQRYLELAPDDAMAHGYLAVALVELGRRAEALAHFARAAELKKKR